MANANIQPTDRFDDNTRVGCYKDCPRRFFLRHVMHFRSVGTSATLAFGGSWHAGQDIVWAFAKDHSMQDLANMAYLKFCEKWEEEGFSAELDPDMQKALEPRTPNAAWNMYHQYVQTRWRMLQDSELIQVEQPFAVPMPNRDHSWYVGRLDKVIKYQGRTIALEHKTTAMYSKASGFQSSYLEGWFSDSQIKGYLFGGALYYPDLREVWVDAALVHKTVHDQFRFVPVNHQFDMIQEWLNDTHEWVARMARDEEVWQKTGVLGAGIFPKNENQCQGKYGNCAFIDLCRTTPNTAFTPDMEPPAGFMIEEWKPFETLGLEKILEKTE